MILKAFVYLNGCIAMISEAFLAKRSGMIFFRERGKEKPFVGEEDTIVAMKTIGIMGGMGWESTAVYYRIINQQVREALGVFHSAKIIIDSLDFHAIATAANKSEYERVQLSLVQSALRLQEAGADVLLIACNTVHRMAPAIVQAISIPFLHIANCAGEALLADGHTRIGLLGTRATMQGQFYRKRLQSQFSLEVITPDPKTINEVDAVIREELVSGIDPQSAVKRLDEAMVALREDGCTAVLLACTELGIAYGASGDRVIHRSIPAYDTAVLHAHAAVFFACNTL